MAAGDGERERVRNMLMKRIVIIIMLCVYYMAFSCLAEENVVAFMYDDTAFDRYIEEKPYMSAEQYDDMFIGNIDMAIAYADISKEQLEKYYGLSIGDKVYSVVLDTINNIWEIKYGFQVEEYTTLESYVVEISALNGEIIRQSVMNEVCEVTSVPSITHYDVYRICSEYLDALHDDEKLTDCLIWTIEYDKDDEAYIAYMSNHYTLESEAEYDTLSYAYIVLSAEGYLVDAMILDNNY